MRDLNFYDTELTTCCTSVPLGIAHTSCCYGTLRGVLAHQRPVSLRWHCGSCFQCTTCQILVSDRLVVTRNCLIGGLVRHERLLLHGAQTTKRCVLHAFHLAASNADRTLVLSSTLCLVTDGFTPTKALESKKTPLSSARKHVVCVFKAASEAVLLYHLVGLLVVRQPKRSLCLLSSVLTVLSEPQESKAF